MNYDEIKNIDWSDSEDSNDAFSNSKEARCSYCCKIFLNQLQITKHEGTCEIAINCTARKVTCKDGTSKFICDICCRTYKYANSLAEHEKRHKEPGGFACKYCKNSFCSEIQLEQHTEETHKVYKCQICKDTFDTADSYIYHIEITHNGQDKLYHVCEDCGRQFSSLHILKFHKHTKCGTLRPYNCEKCEKSFKTKYLLKAHDLLHLEGKQYCCSFCGNKFATKAALQRHERRHTGEKPFKCQICGKTFAYGESLVTHSSVHTGIKPYLCECCGSRFSCTGNLLAHRRKRLDTCGQPQYCTKLAKACPRPSIKTHEPSKSLVIKAHKVLKDVETIKTKKTRISKKIRVKTEEINITNNKINLKYEDEDELPLAVVKEIFESEITIKENQLNIPAIKIENEIISTNESKFNNAKTFREKNEDNNFKIEVIEYELAPVLTLKRDPADSSMSDINEFNIRDLNNASVNSLSSDITTNNITSDYINSFKKLNKKRSQNNDGEEYAPNFSCHICSKTYKFFKSFQSHLKLHEYFNTRKKFTNKTNIIGGRRSEKSGHSNKIGNDNPYNNTSDDNIENKNDTSIKNSLRNSLEINRLKEASNYVNMAVENKTIVQERFECSECFRKSFRRKSTFIRHLRNIHKKASTEIWKILLVNSDKTHDNSIDLQCKICGKLYSLVKTLEKHIQMHGPDGSLIHTCRSCSKYFATKEEVHTHTVTEHKDKITCVICNKIYKDAELLQAHHRYSHSDAPSEKPKKYTFICNKCGRTVSSRTALTNHELSDCGKNPIHKCNVCGKGLHSAGSLKSHMLVHSGELEFKCQFCDKGFARKGQCQIHERKHTGEKPFPCTYCDKAFAYRENLLIHISTHTGLKRYMCNSCGERFSCVTGLKAHWRTHARTCGADPNRSTKATGIYLGFQKGQLVHTKEPTETCLK